MKIFLIGSYPPPYGGVSIHLQRLLHSLEDLFDIRQIDTSGIVSDVPNVLAKKEWRMLLYLFFRPGKAIVHFHIFSIKLVYAIFLLALRHKVVVTFHNERFVNTMQSAGSRHYKILRFLLNFASVLIVLNEPCKQLAKSIIKQHEKIRILPNFIAPKPIPHLDKRIDVLRKKHRFLLASNAWQIRFHEGADLYGIDQLIELTERLQSAFDVAFIFLLPDIGDEAYFKVMQAKIDAAGLKEHFIFITEPVSGPAVWKAADLVIRATNTDGNSLTVLEALSLGTPVLASNCAERPEGTVLFKTRSIDDMFLQVTHILKNPEKYTRELQDGPHTKTVGLFKELYSHLQTEGSS